MGALAFVFWDSWALWPLKVLVVLFHELSHALAALLTGGEVLQIGLSADQGGTTSTRGGWTFLILNAGYVGSLLWGVALLGASRRPKSARIALGALGVLLVVVTFLFVRPLISFGFGFALLAGVGITALARAASAATSEWALRGLGVFSVLYALHDILADVFFVDAEAITDAAMLAQLTGIPAIVWGGVWLAAGVGTLVSVRRWLV